MSSAVAALELAERAPLALPPADDELLLLLPPPLRPPLLLLLLALDREEGDGHLPHDLRHETSMKDGLFLHSPDCAPAAPPRHGIARVSGEDRAAAAARVAVRRAFRFVAVSAHSRDTRRCRPRTERRRVRALSCKRGEEESSRRPARGAAGALAYTRPTFALSSGWMLRGGPVDAAHAP